MALSDAAARKARPGERPYKLGDARGLYLFVTPAGGKIWRLKYRFGGKEKVAVLGPYPEVSLAEARELTDNARRLLRDGKDPAVEKRKARSASIASADLTFESGARDWHAINVPRWSSVHAADILTALERDIFPKIGALPMAEIDTAIVLDALRAVERRGAIETARRHRQRISAVYLFWIAQGAAVSDPAPVSLVRAMKPLPKKGKQPALVEIDTLRSVLRAAEASDATPFTKLASRLLALTVVRPGVVAGARWEEFEKIDWNTGESADALWRVPARRMKLTLERKDEAAFEHVVPLAPQSVEVVLAVWRLSGRNGYLFPNQRHSHKPMSGNAIGYLYNRAGFHGRHVPHGWRAAFSTIMNEIADREQRSNDRAIIDLMLAHVPKNKVEGAYNRAAYLPRRREIAEAWALMLLEGLPPAGDVLDGGRS